MADDDQLSPTGARSIEAASTTSARTNEKIVTGDGANSNNVPKSTSATTAPGPRSVRAGGEQKKTVKHGDDLPSTTPPSTSRKREQIDTDRWTKRQRVVIILDDDEDGPITNLQKPPTTGNLTPILKMPSTKTVDSTPKKMVRFDIPRPAPANVSASAKLPHTTTPSRGPIQATSASTQTANLLPTAAEQWKSKYYGLKEAAKKKIEEYETKLKRQDKEIKRLEGVATELRTTITSTQDEIQRALANQSASTAVADGDMETFDTMGDSVGRTWRGYRNKAIESLKIRRVEQMQEGWRAEEE